MSIHCPSRKALTRAAFVTSACAGGLLLTAGIASAHIESDPAAVEAGTAATVGFAVEHGCEGSPTTELRFQVPETVTDAQPVDKNGWTTSIDGRVVTFTGGSLGPTTTDTFAITFTAPAETGTIHFPVVQHCEQGENAWIELPAADGTEPDRPAPAVKVTDGPPTSDDLAGDHGGAESGGGHHDSETASEGDEASDTGDDGVSGGLIAAGVIALAIIGGAATLVVRRRRDTTG